MTFIKKDIILKIYHNIYKIIPKKNHTFKAFSNNHEKNTQF